MFTILLYYPYLSVHLAAENAHDFQNPVEVPGQSGFLIRVGRWRKRYDRCKLLRGWFCVFKMGSGCGTPSKWAFLWLINGGYDLTTYKSWDDPPSIIVKNFKMFKMMSLFKKKQHRLCKPISRQICSLLLVLMTLLSGHPKEASKDWKRLWKGWNYWWHCTVFALDLSNKLGVAILNFILQYLSLREGLFVMKTRDDSIRGTCCGRDTGTCAEPKKCMEFVFTESSRILGKRWQPMCLWVSNLSSFSKYHGQ